MSVVGSKVEEAAMSATVIPLLTYDKLYPLGDMPERRERSYGSRTPPLYSLSLDLVAGKLDALEVVP